MLIYGRRKRAPFFAKSHLFDCGGYWTASKIANFSRNRDFWARNWGQREHPRLRGGGDWIRTDRSLYLPRRSAVLHSVAMPTEGDQVVDVVMSKHTSRFDVMNFEVCHCSAILASPLVTFEHFEAQLLVVCTVQPQPRPSLPNLLIHAIFASARNRSRSAEGRNDSSCFIEISIALGSRFSRLAPARKSAQIISRQYPLDLSVPSINAAVSSACSTTGI